LLVSGLGIAPADVAGDHILDPFQLVEDGFQAPETAAGERGGFPPGRLLLFWPAAFTSLAI
jgi:hypothetical protein